MKSTACLALAALFTAGVQANDNGLGLTPPQGWRSWNLYGNNVNQSLIMDIMTGMTKKRGTPAVSLQDLGYGDVGLDDNWQACGSPEAAEGMHYHDAKGNPIVNLKTFPDFTKVTRGHFHTMHTSIAIASVPSHTIHLCPIRRALHETLWPMAACPFHNYASIAISRLSPPRLKKWRALRETRWPTAADDRSRAQPRAHLRLVRQQLRLLGPLRAGLGAGEKDAKLAQKLGQLQPFLAAFPQECVGQLASSGPA
jgi:hypothetical protein